MLGVTVGFKALCDSVSNLQQACACVLELLLVGQTLVWLVQLLQSLFDRPHALLTLHTQIKYYCSHELLAETLTRHLQTPLA